MSFDGINWNRVRGTVADGLLVNLGGNNDVTVTGTVAVTQSGTWDEVGINDSGNSITVDAPVATPVFVRLSDGAAAISTLPVSLASVPSHAVTNAGTFAVQESGAALTALQLIDNLVLAEDAAHVSGDPGVQALAVRKDSGAAIAGTDGDYSPLQVDASGNLRVNVAAGGAGDGAILDGVSGSIKATVFDYTGSNPLAVRLTDTNGDYVGAGAGTQYTEDAAAAANPVGTALILVRDDARIGGVTNADGDNIAARGNNKGELFVKDTDAETTLNAILTSLGYIQPDTVTIATGTGNSATSLDIIDDWDESDRAKVNLIQNEAGITGGPGTAESNTPRVTLASNDPAVMSLSDISSAAQDTLTEMQVLSAAAKREDDPHTNSDRGIPALAVRRDAATSGTSADGDYATLNVDGNGRLYVRLDEVNALIESLANALVSVDADSMATESRVPHDSADFGNPHKIGHVAKNFDGSAPGTPVAEDDRVNSVADVYGRQYVETTHPNYWSVSADYASAQTNTSIKAAPGVGLKLYITDVIISNGATAGNVTLLDGSGGTVKLEIYPGVNGGLAHPFRTPIALTANTALCITSTTVTTHSVTICGYTAP